MILTEEQTIRLQATYVKRVCTSRILFGMIVLFGLLSNILVCFFCFAMTELSVVGMQVGGGGRGRKVVQTIGNRITVYP